MPQYITAQDIVNFLHIIDRSNGDNHGSVLTIGTNTDPPESLINSLIDQHESVVDMMLLHSYGNKTKIDEVHHMHTYVEHYRDRFKLNLTYDNIKSWNEAEGDKIEYWERDEGWTSRILDEIGVLEPTQGVIHIRELPYAYEGRGSVRISYRYGLSTIPPWLKRLVILLVSVDMVNTAWALNAMTALPDGQLSEAITQWREEIKSIMSNQEAIVVEKA